MKCLRRIGSLVCLASFTASLSAQQDPAWWNNVIRSGDDHSTESNYSPANLGQLKNFAAEAKLHLDAELFAMGQAGTELTSLVSESNWPREDPGNYAPLSLGQLKATVDKFYARLDAVQFDYKAQLLANGYGGPWTGNRPWDESAPLDSNYTVANLGQLKILFSFDLSGYDTDLDGLPDWWEWQIIQASQSDGNPNNDLHTLAQVLPTGDFDGDGINNKREFELDSDPTDARSGLDAALLGRWKFNEGEGSAFEDSTEFDHPGTLVGNFAWGTEAGGRKFLMLSDGNATAQIPAADMLLGANEEEFTVAFWAKLSASTGSYRSVIRKGDASTERTFNIIARNNDMRLEYRISIESDLNRGWNSAGALTAGEWTYLVYVKRSGQVRLYINGQLDSQMSLATPVVANAGAIRIGKNPLHSGVAGSYDDLQIYGVALTTAEIAMLYAASDDMDSDGDGLTDYEEARLGTNPNLPDSDWDGVSDSRELADGTDPNDPESVIQRRIAYFPFDALDALDLRSAEGQVPKAILGGASQVAGARGRALYSNTALARVHYDWMRPSGDLNVSIRTGSVRLWFKPDWSSPTMSGNWSRFFEMGEYTPDNTKAWFGFHLHATAPGIHVGTKDGNGHGTSPLFSLASNAFAAGQWHQITLTYSPTHRRIFLNGALVSELAVNYAYLPDIADFAQDGIEFASDGWQSIKGAIDEVEFFNYELDAPQILADYNAMAPLLVSTNNPHGLPDWWVDEYFPGGLPSGFDPDAVSFGMTFREKAAFGLDPHNESTNDIGIPDRIAGWRTMASTRSPPIPMPTTRRASETGCPSISNTNIAQIRI